ncbi:hypothetical protein [Halorubrum amylolyticum]|nr:hypothetical protein [Halorubrum amylolyticum]
MAEEYNPTLSAYENVFGSTINLGPVDITEEEMDAALKELHNG